MITTKQRLLCLAVFAAMTTACSSGGSSLNTGGGSTIPTNGDNDPTTPETPKTQYEKVEDSSITKLNQADNSEPAPQVEYGYTLATPVSGYIAGGKSYNIDVDIDTKNAQKDDSENYDKIEFVIHPNDDYPSQEEVATKSIDLPSLKESLTLDAGANITGDQPLKPEDYSLLKAGYTSDYATLAKFFELNNTKIGGIFNPVTPEGYYGNLFYKAKGATENLPALGTATYNGVWDVTQAVPQPGEHTAGYDTGEFTEFAPMQLNVNFGDNTVDGKFEKKLAHKQAYAYTFEGKLKGNTFTGEATQSNISQDNLDNATRIQDKADVSGGFFGDKAQEIAGKIISKDRTGMAEVEKMDPRIFGVFVAKQTENEGLKEVVYNQAKAINFDEKSKPVFTTSFEDIMENTEKLSNLDEITLNGVKINLIEAAENSDIFTNTDELPLQFTRIGAVQADAKEPTYTYFYQGQLTQAMPETGTANYEGNWIGYGQAQDGPAFSMSKESNGLIKFDADFASKVLSGEFLTASGKNAMTLHEVGIDGNTFKGTAKITADGLVNDNHINKGAIKGEVMLSGGFFGDNANELGGQFNKEDLSFAGVFAGKQTAKK